MGLGQHGEGLACQRERARQPQFMNSRNGVKFESTMYSKMYLGKININLQRKLVENEIKNISLADDESWFSHSSSLFLPIRQEFCPLSS